MQSPTLLPSTLTMCTVAGGYHWNELMAPRFEAFEIVIRYRWVPGRNVSAVLKSFGSIRGSRSTGIPRR